MKKNPVNIDRPELSDEEALKHKDFNRVLEKQASLKPEPPSIAKNPWIWGGGALLTLSLITLFFLAPGTAEPEVINQAEGRSAIQPLSDETDIPATSFRFNSDEGYKTEMPNGTIIEIPAQAFEDKYGNPIDGEVEIRFREFHRPEEIVLSGIPMVYDSAGEEQHFESAGMIEILGFQNDEPIFIRPNKAITVHMASQQPGDQFNLYKLDSETGEWDYLDEDPNGIPFGELARIDSQLQGSEPMMNIESLNADLNQLKQAGLVASQNAPVMPEQLDEDQFSISLEVDPKEFPELDVYRDVLFQVDPEDPQFKPELANTTWDNASIAKGPNGSYLLTFSKGAESITIKSKPVVREENMAAAKSTFDARFAQYEEKLEERHQAEAEKRAQLEREYEALDRLRIERWNREKELQASRERKARLVANSQDLLYRTFSVSAFGIWNSDCPMNLPQEKVLAAEFVNQKNEPLNMNTVYLVQSDANAVYTYSKSSLRNFRYDPEAANLLIGVTKDNKIAVFRGDDFAAMGDPQERYRFRMHVASRSFTNPEDALSFMEL